MSFLSLAGLWTCEIPGQTAPIRIPGTLDQSDIGLPDKGSNQWHPDINGKEGLFEEGAPIATRLTRRHTYEGPARIFRDLTWPVPPGRRILLEAERARKLTLRVNGREIAPCVPGTVSTPWVFEITEAVTGRDHLELISDNSYPGWPRDAIVYSSSATDETQTNWNGLPGRVGLRIEDPVFLEDLRVYPRGDTLEVRVTLNADRPWQGTLRLASEALEREAALPVSAEPGRTEARLSGLPLRPDFPRWDEGDGRLARLSVSTPGLSPLSVRFGLRDFRARDGHLTLNGRRFFLRGEANCAVFPETGCCPMTVEAWRHILEVYRSYGVNCMRFHSHCPPEAAFTAADEAGMLMQPELSCWDPKDAFGSEESRRYYRLELLSVLRMLANHPSFVMLTLGNELHASPAGHAFMDALLEEARKTDDTRLYANGSNVHYGNLGCDPASDFYTSSNYYSEKLRATGANMTGWLNQRYPDFRLDYSAPMAALRRDWDGPVFSFEVGQYEVLPDFDELADFRGVTRPVNYQIVRDRVRSRGLMPSWKRRVEASGELSLLCYRAEIEAALRTEALSGISLLGLQDFPGQGTALVGMLNAHLRPKPFPFAAPERFRSFFRGVLPLALLPRLTWETDETLQTEIRLANYGREPLRGVPEWELEGNGFRAAGQLPEAEAPCGALTSLGEIRFPLREAPAPARLTLRLSLAGQENTYSLWVYPPSAPVCPPTVHEASSLDAEALAVLGRGGTVYLTPPSTKEALPHSIQAQFSTDFWSVGIFAGQEGAMGQLIAADHPAFRLFPTDFHTDWQWWPMAGQRAAVVPEDWPSLITVLDSYATLRAMTQLTECRCGGGRLLLSTLGLQELQQYPEARALLRSLYAYLASEDFRPEREITPEEIRKIVPGLQPACSRI